MRSARSDQSSRTEVPVSLATASTVEEVVEALLSNNDSLRKLLRWCLRHLGTAATEQDAEDALQAFCTNRLSHVIVTYKPGSQSLESYIFLCLQRLCWRRAKRLKQRRRREVPLSDVAPDANGRDGHSNVPPDQIAAARTYAIDGLVLQEDRATMRSLLSNLSASDQEVLSLHYDLELTAAQIGSRLHLSEAAVELRLHRARKKLESRLKRLPGVRT